MSKSRKKQVPAAGKQPAAPDGNNEVVPAADAAPTPPAEPAQALDAPAPQEPVDAQATQAQAPETPESPAPAEAQAPIEEASTEAAIDSAAPPEVPAEAVVSPQNAAPAPTEEAAPVARAAELPPSSPPQGGRCPATEAEINAVVEAILFTTDSPLAPAKIANVAQAPLRAVKHAISALNARYEQAGSAFRIEEIAGGFQMMTLGEYHEVLSRLLQVRADTRLSGAAMETLAIIAYRQPILRADIEVIRGVASGEVLRGLMEKQLVKIVGRAEVLGRPMLYGTTKRFLEIFGLASLEDLPRVEELKAGAKTAKPIAAAATEGEAAQDASAPVTEATAAQLDEATEEAPEPVATAEEPQDEQPAIDEEADEDIDELDEDIEDEEDEDDEDDEDDELDEDDEDDEDDDDLDEEDDEDDEDDDEEDLDEDEEDDEPQSDQGTLEQEDGKKTN